MKGDSLNVKISFNPWIKVSRTTLYVWKFEAFATSVAFNKHLLYKNKNIA